MPSSAQIARTSSTQSATVRRHLLSRRHALGNYGICRRLKRRPGQRLTLARSPDWLNRVHIGSWDASGEEAGVELAPIRVIATSALDHLTVGTQEEIEPFVWRMAAPTVKVGILDDQSAAWAHGGPHAAQ